MWRVLLLAVVACKAGEGDDFPIEPGGPNPGGMGFMVDAAPIDAFVGDAQQSITGRVCLVADLRALGACAATGAGGITVTLGTRTATTLDSGAFTIMTPSGSNLVWRARGAQLVTSVMAFGPATTIPIIGDQAYLDLQGANSVVVIDGQGSIVARIVRNGVPVSGAVASTSPLAQYATKYDGVTASAWTELATSTAGTAWIAGAALGANVVTATPASGAAADETVLVEDQAITYVTIDLP
jgi:hypothetical protein